MKKLTILFTLALFGLMYSCKEETLDPTLAQDKLVDDIKTVDDLGGILGGMYDDMSQSEYYGSSVIQFAELRADNCYANGTSGRMLSPASMKMGTTDGYATNTWGRIYRVVAAANNVISRKDLPLKGDQGEMKQIIGQAFAIRALAHFDLLKLYGQQHVTGGDNLGIPYITEFVNGNTMTSTNIFPKRNTVNEVKELLYSDLTTALTFMDEEYNDPSKMYVTTYAVEAIRARIATYFGDYTIAKTACLSIINSTKFKIIDKENYVESWSTKSPVNSIFELAFSSTDNAGNLSLSFLYRGDVYGDVRVLGNLRDIFDADDIRNSSKMIGMSDGFLSNLGKYPSKDYSDDVFLFRYEEVILNYAEALFNINNSDPEALVQLNSIPANRDAKLYTTINMDNILLERRKELCFEGFRFDDLARTHKDIPYSTLPSADQKNTRHGDVAYGSYKYAFPIPKNEIDANPLCLQNVEY